MGHLKKRISIFSTSKFKMDATKYKHLISTVVFPALENVGLTSKIMSQGYLEADMLKKSHLI